MAKKQPEPVPLFEKGELLLLAVMGTAFFFIVAGYFLYMEIVSDSITSAECINQDKVLVGEYSHGKVKITGEEFECTQYLVVMDAEMYERLAK